MTNKRGRQQAQSQEAQDKMIEMYKAGIKVKDIAKELGLSVMTIGKYLKKNGIKLTDNILTKQKDERKKLIIGYIKQEKRPAWIAEKIGVTGAYVSGIKHKYLKEKYRK